MTLSPAPLRADVANGPDEGRAYWWRARDGVRLRLGHWCRGDRGTVLLFPGRSEVIEKYGPTARALRDRGWGVLTIDWRGQGLSDRLAPDPDLGHVRHFLDYQQDVAAMVAAARTLGLARPWMLLAHSMGGCIGLRALHEGLAVRAAAFSAPMWGLPLPITSRAAARLFDRAARLFGATARPVPGQAPGIAPEKLPFDMNVLTTDRATYGWIQRMLVEAPELRLGAPSLGWLAAALREMARLARHPPPPLPALAAVGSLEKVVDAGAVARGIARWPEGRLVVIDGAEHELMMESPARRAAFMDPALALFDARG